MKAIIFDIDGVVIKSTSQKKKAVKDVLEKYGLYKIQEVQEIVKAGLNRNPQ